MPVGSSLVIFSTPVGRWRRSANVCEIGTLSYIRFMPVAGIIAASGSFPRGHLNKQCKGRADSGRLTERLLYSSVTGRRYGGIEGRSVARYPLPSNVLKMPPSQVRACSNPPTSRRTRPSLGRAGTGACVEEVRSRA